MVFRNRARQHSPLLCIQPNLEWCEHQIPLHEIHRHFEWQTLKGPL